MKRMTFASAICVAAMFSVPAFGGGTPINGPYSQGSGRGMATPKQSACEYYISQNQYRFDRMPAGPDRAEAMDEVRMARSHDSPMNSKTCVSMVQHALELTRRH